MASPFKVKVKFEGSDKGRSNHISRITFISEITYAKELWHGRKTITFHTNRLSETVSLIMLISTFSER